MCDGDKALVIKDKTLTTCANAYTGGNIGPISNNITKVWNSGKIQEEQINVVKWLCMENNQVID